MKNWTSSVQPEGGTSGGGGPFGDSPATDICQLEAMTTDAFTLELAELRAYANQPCSLIGRVLAQAC